MITRRNQGRLQGFLWGFILAAGLAVLFGGCASIQRPAEALDTFGGGLVPIVRTVCHPVAHFGVASSRGSGWSCIPVALDVTNPNPYDTRAEVACTYTTATRYITAGQTVRVPVKLGDGQCGVTLFYVYSVPR